MYSLTLALFSISASFFLTATLALPQASCFAGVCYPYVRYGHPNYDEWAQHEVDKWREAERTRNNRNKNKDKHLHDRAEPAPPVDVSGVVTSDDKTDDELAGVYICEDNAWGGACTHTYSRLGSDPLDCTIIDGRASSIGPDPGYHCIFYTNSFCATLTTDRSETLTLSYPGSDNLGFTEQGDFNDRVLSYSCFKSDFSLDPVEGVKDVDKAKME
ncbi:uncharacterized protein EKO05_0006303 [Ascochyta rabiei]|uniref:Uncharacterized protein n=1 Tax=Didymella rabiei TaxID=5454 RepID=A0A163AZ99_DIDRA|nr:uncharacterized protein EKO05_0006303 [Ascochyta rabiei]KZM21482.1 hypothetical protein ST47_g7325 [Ascochyta rabiei]UPX15867.1 hypothetical protein EKO05_0006303 [Ascochyta rabiei]